MNIWPIIKVAMFATLIGAGCSDRSGGDTETGAMESPAPKIVHLTLNSPEIRSHLSEAYLNCDADGARVTIVVLNCAQAETERLWEQVERAKKAAMAHDPDGRLMALLERREEAMSSSCDYQSTLAGEGTLTAVVFRECYLLNSVLYLNEIAEL